MAEKFDVIVVGAGPAGSCCAKKIAEAGFSVIMYDRREELGVPVRCGEGLEQAAEEFIGKIPQRAICSFIKGARIYAPNGKFLEVDMTKIEGGRGGYILDRKVFDKWLAHEAIKDGAHCQVDTLITDLIIENGTVKGVKGNFGGDTFEARSNIVVAATGAESPLAQQSGLKTFCKMSLVDTCIEYEMAGVEIEGQKNWEDFIHLWVGNEVAPRGYQWVFPKGDRSANIGVGILPNDKHTAYYYNDKFIRSHPGLAKGQILEVKGGLVPVGGFLQDMVTNGFLVCGEAAHHVNPIHGGGIKEAIVSGQLAGDVIVDALRAGDVSKRKLSAFNENWWRIRGNHLRNVEKLREVFEKMSDKDLNELVDILEPEYIIEFARGAKIGILASILARKPQLALLARHLL